ncbi:MFS transporter [Streptoalloteichus hindustanus]|uniref:Transmembrane secretion effector n=1 Tax=Streptoalloteichus hindustanus TaxID=2017 RepID=A0A1M5NLM6_STRHI|nr:MFS transporter [Streptoalloteichus hindustanus]SHG90345.1 Transmembrane secretion effector [Streptoalloteichus hindustanus]
MGERGADGGVRSDSAEPRRDVGPAGGADASGGADRPAGPARGVRTPAFHRLLAAWTVSLVGDGVRVVALPLFAAVTTRDPLAVSAVAVAEVLPWLLVALPAGALVDRWRPRRVVLVAHVLRGAVTLGLAAAVATGHAGVWALVCVAFVLTSAETFADSASQLLLVEIAGPADLDAANGRFISAETVGVDLAGPLAATLVFAWEPAACFAVDGLSFVVAAALVASLPDVVPHRESTAGTRLRAQIAEGGRYLLGHRGLRALVGVVVVAAVAASAVNAVTALYAIEALAIPAAVVPTLMVAMAVGTIVAARAVPRLVGWLGEGRVMVASLVVLAAGFAGLGLAPHPVTAWVGYLVVGVGVGAWNVLSATRRQRLTPGHMMGRVSSTYRVLTWGLMPLGAGVAGPLAKATSLGAVFVLAGGLVAATALVAAVPLLRTGAGGPEPEPA